MEKPKLFEVGGVKVDERAATILSQHKMSKYDLLYRHQHGDFGVLDEESAKHALNAAKHNSAVHSIYKVGDDLIHVVTDERRSSTHIYVVAE